MTRAIPIAMTLLFALLAGIVVGAERLIARDREGLLARFAAERFAQVQETADLSRRDLDGMALLLRLAGRLTEGEGHAGPESRELEAMLAASEHLRLLRVFDSTGAVRLTAGSPGSTASAEASRIDAELQLAASRSLTRGGELELSVPLAVNGRSMRVYALALARPGAPPFGAVAALVDSERLLARLSVLAADPALKVLLLGPRGRPTPSSNPLLAAALDEQETAQPQFSAMVTALKAGERGTRWVPADESRRLGVGDADALVAFAPVSTDGLGTWSLAILTSTSVLRAAETSLTRRFGAAAVAIIITLLAFGALVVALARKSAQASERLAQGERLARLHQRTERTLDNIPAGVLTIDAQHRVTAANRVLRQRMAQPLPGSLAASLPNAPAAVIDRLGALLAAAVTTQTVQSIHGERLALFGSEGQYSVHAVPLGEPHDDARALLVVEDVSEVHALESQLLRAEKLATIGVLVAGLAHEVGTPLGIVRARGEYVLDKLGADHPQARGLGVMIEQIDRVTRTIRRMLDFSRVTPATVRPFAPGQLTAWLNDVMRYEARRRKVELELAFADALPLVSADPDQLQQLLLNLVMNACDACTAGGHVTVSAEPATAAAGWSCVRFEVADDGCGIPPEQRQGIFDPFFTTKKRGQGTGLGLTVAAQIVRNHGGELELESEVGRGTRIIVFWPLSGRPALEAADEHVE